MCLFLKNAQAHSYVKVHRVLYSKVVAKLLLGVSCDTHTLSSAELRDLCEVEFFWEVFFEECTCRFLCGAREPLPFFSHPDS